MRRFGQFFLPVFLIAVVASHAHAQAPWTGIIDPNRAIDWSSTSPGVIGGIPSGSWAQCGSTVAAGTSAATINALLAACPVNTYLLLGPGTFNLSTYIVFNNISNRVVRGSGADQTFLVFGPGEAAANCRGTYSDMCIESGDLNYNGAPSNAANWTAGYAKGNTTITLSSATNLKVGYPIILDQLDNAPSEASNNDIFLCAFNQNVCTANGDSGGGHRPGVAAGNRGQQQLVTVTQCDGNSTLGHACSSGANITISPGLYMPNWCRDGGSCSATQPGAWWATSPVFNDGIENLSMDHSTETDQNTRGIEIFNCIGCWVSGVRSIKAGRSHVEWDFSPHTTIQNSYFWKTFATTSVSYGIEPNASSDSLMQNNIFEGITEPIATNGTCSGCVVAYNFTVNMWYSPSNQVLASMSLHAEGDDTMLIEGNVFNQWSGDSIHGSHNMVTLFRNVYSGYMQNNGLLPVNNETAFVIDSYNRFINEIDNVIGNSYSTNYNHVTNGIPAIQSLGGGNQVPDDPFTKTSAMLWGNWDAVTGTRFCGPGAPGFSSPPCSSVSEVPSTITHWPNPVPASTTFPPSFLYRSTPSWWPNGKPWPPMGSDVVGGNMGTCNGGVNAAAYVNTSGQCLLGTLYNLGGHANSIPAMDCFLNTMGGSPIGMDLLPLTFNPSACYTQSVSNPPQPPTNLSATVN